MLQDAYFPPTEHSLELVAQAYWTTTGCEPPPCILLHLASKTRPRSSRRGEENKGGETIHTTYAVRRAQLGPTLSIGPGLDGVRRMRKMPQTMQVPPKTRQPRTIEGIHREAPSPNRRKKKKSHILGERHRNHAVN